MFGLLSRSLAAFALFAAISIAPWTAGAGPITTVPTSLHSGDEYRLAFVTSTTRDALSTEIGVYNTFVSNLANAQSALNALGTTWMAIASTPTMNALTNTSTDPGPDATPTGVPIFLLNDTKLVDNYDDLWDGYLALPLNVTEAEGTSGYATVWTGTSISGSATGYPLGGNQVTIGLAVAYANAWVDNSYSITQWPDGGDIVFRRLYGISGVLTVASDTGPGPDQIPEPGTIALFGAGLAIFVLARRSRRRGDCQP